ncbi:CCR4-NOT transcription complex subunit 9 [Drosophila ficusphila]|uniref:CCR4-NOT transcription complex subunit 9 n=1 Tax=Drosophila ficusphila TaxID=30025 RepID=UPI0007E75E14|nr:CCR4-NOT transcription complex subunit 9 [Drosophila ficusphila]XP_017057264.1 CCR4-NOT transcription complex subunit 9 [Drosophila ficusphila]XP_017057265.1 CCR4-NOT transcription complex subunit 9 [Drosophila ficusphila]XP_043065217.1 CCR4-NOT transcription complex subunit 9 [Drosophila ficusphila]
MTLPNSGCEQRSEADNVYGWITDLCDKEKRLMAMLELCERRSQIESLGPLLWHSFGAVSGLLQEVVSVYPAALANELSGQQSQRVCAAIGLFQAMASHPAIGIQLMRSQFMWFLMPLLKMTPKTRAIEHVRLSVLGVVCGLLKSDHPEIVSYFLGIELIPLILRQLELGSSMSKVLCAFVLCRILEHEVGLKFASRRLARRLHLIHTLARVVHQLTLEPEPRILKHVVRVYSRLADHPQNLELIVKHMPAQLRNGYFCQENKPGYESASIEFAELNRKLFSNDGEKAQGFEK